MPDLKNESDIVESPESRDVLLPLTPSEDIIEPPVNVEENVIYSTIKQDESPDTILKAVMEGLAEEQYALRTLRQVKGNEGKDVSHIALKRGTLLKYMSETIIQRKSLSGPADELNIRGVKFREVFKMFLDIINTTFEQTKIPQEYKDMFFTKLTTNMEGWEDKAEKIIKSIESPE